MTQPYYVISSAFHGFRVLRVSRSLASATAYAERYAIRHGKECQCMGARVVTYPRSLSIGYMLGDGSGNLAGDAQVQ